MKLFNLLVRLCRNMYKSRQDGSQFFPPSQLQPNEMSYSTLGCNTINNRIKPIISICELAKGNKINELKSTRINV